MDVFLYVYYYDRGLHEPLFQSGEQGACAAFLAIVCCKEFTAVSQLIAGMPESSGVESGRIGNLGHAGGKNAFWRPHVSQNRIEMRF